MCFLKYHIPSSVRLFSANIFIEHMVNLLIFTFHVYRRPWMLYTNGKSTLFLTVRRVFVSTKIHTSYPHIHIEDEYLQIKYTEWSVFDTLNWFRVWVQMVVCVYMLTLWYSDDFSPALAESSWDSVEGDVVEDGWMNGWRGSVCVKKKISRWLMEAVREEGRAFAWVSAARPI